MLRKTHTKTQVMKHWLLLMVIFDIFRAEEVNLFFSQNDFDGKLDILECSWYNKSYYKYVEAGLVWINRTQRGSNAKFEYFYDPRDNMFIEVQVYKMTSNEYRFFPVTFKMNLCAEYKKNSFSLRQMLNASSNMDPCDMKRDFPYVINKMVLDFSTFPPHLPRGSYKMVMKFFVKSEYEAQVDFYFRVIDKPIDWKKLPSVKRSHQRT